MADHFFVHCDGGARGNPGPAGVGIVIERKREREKEVVAEISEYIGETTNNQAEYRAVIRALEVLLQRINNQQSATNDKKPAIDFFLDSELIVEQMKGNYRIKHAELKPLYARVQALLSELGAEATFHAVPRSENKRADQLVNRAIDQALANEQRTMNRE